MVTHKGVAHAPLKKHTYVCLFSGVTGACFLKLLQVGTLSKHF